MMHPRYSIIYIVFVLFIVMAMSCTQTSFDERWLHPSKFEHELVLHAPLDESLFPADFAAPRIAWQPVDAQQYAVAISDSNDILFSMFLQDTTCLVEEQAWQQMLSMPNTSFRLSVLALKRGVVAGKHIQFSISPDSVAAPIFYRSVPLPFEYALRHLDEIEWRLGSVSESGESKVILKNLPLCGNCHSFSADGSTLAMDVDYANDKGSFITTEIEAKTVMTPEKIISWSEFDDAGKKTFGLLSQISPDGRYVVSTVKDRSIFVPKPDLHYSQLFFPIKGILAIYDRQTDTFFSLPGADDPEFVQSNPEWSPDGEFIYFCRARAYHSAAADTSESIVLPTKVAEEFISGQRDFKYDIYRIPFNQGRGGIAKPVAGASRNGKSNCFPKISPDGACMVFVQAENFMLLQPDSKLMLLPLAGGDVREMECNTQNMNSWHSWSPNSKWLVFSSKKFSAYTDLFLTHIDDHGQASPPLWLHHMSRPNRAVNIPEFVNLRNKEWHSLVDDFTSQPHYYFSIGRNKLGEKKIKEAMQAFEKTIEMDSTFRDAYIFKGHVHFANAAYEKALNAYAKAIELNESDADLWQNYAATCAKLGRDEKATAAYRKVLGLDENNDDAWLGLAVLQKKQQEYQQAVKSFSAALAIQKTVDSFQGRGLCYAYLGDYANAEADFAQAVELNKTNAGLLQHLATARYQQKKYAAALQAFQQAVSMDENNADLHEGVADCYMHLRQYENAFAAFDQAVQLAPQDGAAILKRGYVAAQLDQLERACRDFDHARSLGIAQAEQYILTYCR